MSIGLGLEVETHMRKPSGRLGHGLHQRVLEATKVLKSDIERLSQGMRDACHKPAPIAVVGAVVGAIVGVIVGVACEAILWTDDQGPLVGLHKGGG